MTLKIVQLKEQLDKCLNKPFQSHIFLDKFRMIDEASRNTASYKDNRYIPFYYWLGTLLKTKNLVEIGFQLGLFSGCLVKSCKSIEKILAFQEKTQEYYSPRLGIANVRDNYKKWFRLYHGKIHDDVFNRLLWENKWDLVIINQEASYDKCRSYLEICWEHLANDGFVVCDNIKKNKHVEQAFLDFVKIINKPYVFVNTRYKVGIIQK